LTSSSITSPCPGPARGERDRVNGFARGGNPERDTDPAWGESAGGHLAELLGLTTDDPALHEDIGVTGPSSQVSAVVAWYAPSDIAAMAADTGTDPMDPDTREARLLGAPPPVVPIVAAQASPITHVSPRSPAVPVAARRGRSPRPVRAEPKAAQRAVQDGPER
jgi:hypothetical protein